MLIEGLLVQFKNLLPDPHGSQCMCGAQSGFFFNFSKQARGFAFVRFTSTARGKPDKLAAVRNVRVYQQYRTVRLID